MYTNFLFRIFITVLFELYLSNNYEGTFVPE